MGGGIVLTFCVVKLAYIVFGVCWFLCCLVMVFGGLTVVEK